MTRLPLVAACMLGASAAMAEEVRVVNDAEGSRLMVDGRPFIVRGMNWDDVPVGENYTYSLWERPDDEVRRVLDRDMAMLRDMHVNAIRAYVGMPARWIQYVFEQYGIRTVLNHTVGRYGLLVDGAWKASVDYSNSSVRRQLRAEIAALVTQYRGTPGLLMWLLGNENNYGLYWESAAIADLPLAQKETARAEALYSLLGEVVTDVKALDPAHPVALANGDLQHLDLVAKHCRGLDVMGANVYRGRSARDLFDVVKSTLGLPFVFTEFGADAFDAKEGREDPLTQASYLRDQWREIDANTSGHGLAGNAIGGFVFQWSDGWWKHLQESRLDEHDETASWANGGYAEDFVEGENNMNEEWWGVVAKGPARPGELTPLRPRAAYHLLAAGFLHDPYEPGRTREQIEREWNALDPAVFAARAGESPNDPPTLRLSDGWVDLSTFTTGGRGLSAADRLATRLMHTESATVGLELRPAPHLVGHLSFNVLGNVATNPVDEIFFERRGANSVKLYRSDLAWHERWFDLTGFYRTGHFHWGYEGDLFALFPEANDLRGIDTFNADAPAGFVFAGRRGLEGLKFAFGPELWWGANPTTVTKYQGRLGAVEWALMHQQDVAQRAGGGTSSALPLPRTAKSALSLAWRHGDLRLDGGVIVAGYDRVGRAFHVARPTSGPSYLDSGYRVLDDTVRWYDTLGGKVKATWTGGRFNGYAQGAYRGLVADSNADQTITLTGFRLRESGQGNQVHALAGAAVNVSRNWQVAPNLLWQKPLVGPLPSLADRFDKETGTWFPGLAARNQLDDPFWVRSNRETAGAELLVVYDPTPETWFWAWNQTERENAPFAASLDLSYRHLPTAQDAGLGVLATGQVFAFPGSAPAHDLWELWGRFVLNRGPAHLAGTAWAGTAQANGNDARLVTRGGVEARVDVRTLSVSAFAKVHDYGPYDYHRDYNLTFPLQLFADVGLTADKPRWFMPDRTKVGVAAKFRTLDEHSPRFDATSASGREWEVKSYVRFGL